MCLVFREKLFILGDRDRVELAIIGSVRNEVLLQSRVLRHFLPRAQGGGEQKAHDRNRERINGRFQRNRGLHEY